MAMADIAAGIPQVVIKTDLEKKLRAMRSLRAMPARC
jgi:hypothetical protein